MTDAGLEHLKGLTQLHRLNLWHTEVTDAGLEHLKGLTQLRTLELGQTNVTDAGLERLKCLTQLENLWLGDTKVTDAGLRHLKGLTRLSVLDLSGTKVTDSRIADLRQALPHCTLYHYSELDLLQGIGSIPRLHFDPQGHAEACGQGLHRAGQSVRAGQSARNRLHKPLCRPTTSPSKLYRKSTGLLWLAGTSIVIVSRCLQNAS